MGAVYRKIEGTTAYGNSSVNPVLLKLQWPVRFWMLSLYTDFSSGNNYFFKGTNKIT